MSSMNSTRIKILKPGKIGKRPVVTRNLFPEHFKSLASNFCTSLQISIMTTFSFKLELCPNCAQNLSGISKNIENLMI